MAETQFLSIFMRKLLIAYLLRKCKGKFSKSKKNHLMAFKRSKFVANGFI